MAAPEVAVGDGALGFWKAVGAVWPATREQRCWVHRLANGLDKLPQRLQPKAKRALHEIMNASTHADADSALAAFATEYRAKYPKAVSSLERDQEKLFTFFDFPAEHWIHLRRPTRWSRRSARCGCGSESRREPTPEPKDR
jgi:putative transposase